MVKFEILTSLLASLILANEAMTSCMGRRRTGTVDVGRK